LVRRFAAPALLVLALCPHAAADLVDTLVKKVEQSENYKVRLKATGKLARFDDPRAVRALVFALTDPHALVRAASANALGRLGDRSALPKLCKLQRDRDDFVQRTAAKALSAFGGPSVCDAQKIGLRLAVSGAGDSLRGAVEAQLRGKVEADPRVLSEPAKEASHHLELMVRLDEKVDRSGGKVKIECVMSQSIFLLRANDQRSLQGSATQRGALELGSTVTDQALAGQMRVCMEYLVPVVYDGFSGFLDRLR